jgi:hypothetical protein
MSREVIQTGPVWSVYSATCEGKFGISRPYDTREEAEANRQEWLTENYGTAVVLPHVRWSTATRK